MKRPTVVPLHRANARPVRPAPRRESACPSGHRAWPIASVVMGLALASACGSEAARTSADTTPDVAETRPTDVATVSASGNAEAETPQTIEAPRAVRALDDALCGADGAPRKPPEIAQLQAVLPDQIDGWRLRARGLEHDADGNPELALVRFEDAQFGSARTLEIRMIVQGPWQRSPRLSPGITIDPAWTITGLGPVTCSPASVWFRPYEWEIDGKRRPTGESRLNLGFMARVEMRLMGARDAREILDLAGAVPIDRVEALRVAMRGP